MTRIKIYFTTFLVAITLIFSGCAAKKTFFDLSQERDGKIYFQSTNATFKEILTNKNDLPKIEINGVWSFPKGVSKKVPAIILLHGVGGVTEDLPKAHMNEIAANLNGMGIATFIIDSQSPRGVKNFQEAFKNVSLSMRVADAYSALHLLSLHPKIDKNRIGLLGMSRGGNVAMLVQSKKIKERFIKGNLKFASVVLYYPSCILQLKNVDLIDSPILILAGDKDNITPTPLTLKYAERLKSASNAEIEIKVYEDAHHAFDWKFFSGGQHKWFNDLSACQDRYILLEDDGMLYSPFQNKRYDAIYKFEYLFADCQILSEGLLGGKKEARDQSIEEYKAFFKRTLLSGAGI